ncbi:serine/threonine protein kinase [Tolypothrix campylonemoides VB511288]|nr:serine/threonine protein kinase [Tolypothrix campylonemoides VB511288]
MCDCLPSTYKSSQPLEDGSISSSQENLLLNDRYRILKPLGQGGFGKTFLAVDKNWQQTSPTTGLCVIKQFFPQNHTIHHHQKAFELFQQESLRLAELGKHPQIPQLLDTFEQDGQQYIVQEWIDGQTLEEELAEAGAFNEAEIRQLLLEFLPVLQFVHDHQVIHRDIKPANIICRRSSHQLVLVDFGAAKSVNSPIIEKTGTLIGSAEYAAPEQIKGKAVFASDLYSLGVICLHLLTQMSPFDLHDCGEDAWIWREYLTKPISPSLEQILCKLLQKATKRRYTSATEVLEDLNNLPKHVVFPSKPSASVRRNDDFETYFGCSLKENIPASITPYTAALDLHSIASITVFDPQTQAWYHLKAKMEAKDVAPKVTAVLDPRLAGAACTTLVRDEMSQAVSGTTVSGSSNILWRIFTTFAATYVAFFTIACVAAIQSHLTNAAWKVENLRMKVR